MPSLSLDTWRAIARYHPLYFWTLNKTPRVMVESKCLEIIKQYAWQGYKVVGRSDIERAIVRAEQIAHGILNYRVGAEAVALNDVVLSGGLIDLKKNHGESYIQALGTPIITVLGTPTVTISDTDGDGVLDTFTATLATSLTVDPLGTLKIMFPVADRVRRQRLDWSIKPVTITTALNGTTYDITVVGDSRMIASPIKYEGITPEPMSALDPNILSNYITAIQIEQHTTDPSQAIVIQRWNGETQAYSATIRDAKHGLISLNRACCGLWATWCRDPYPPRAIINGVFGYPLGADGDLDVLWQETIAILAACELAGSPCPCDGANVWMDYYCTDLALIDGSSNTMYRKSEKTNPLGTKRGHGVVYDALIDEQHATAFTV